MKIIENKKAPGRQLFKNMPIRFKWLLLLVLGMFLMNAGVIILIHAVRMHTETQPFIRWFISGLYALLCINGGIFLAGHAYRLRIRLDIRREIRRELKKFTDKTKKKASPKKDEASNEN